MSTKTNNAPANAPANTPANAPATPQFDAIMKATARKGLTPSMLSKALDKAGIVLDNSAKAAETARENLRKGGAEWVPVTSDADMLVVLADIVRGNLSAAENGIRNACIALAVIDETGEYKRGLNGKGAPYTSTLALARDLFPTLEKSTVANYITAGRQVFLPAARGQYGKASDALLQQSPTNAAILAGYVASSDKAIQRKALDAVKTAFEKGKGHVSKKSAQAIAKSLKPDSDKGKGIATNDKKSMEAAKAEYNAMNEMDAYNGVLKQLLEYVPQALRMKSDGDITIVIPAQHVESFGGLIAKAIVSNDEKEKTRVLKALRKVIVG